MRILFLDYDGVVNTPMWDSLGRRCRFNTSFDGKVNNFQAVQWISELCQKYDFKIVITSTWRFDKNYKECLINGGLRPGIEILGRTPDLSVPGKRTLRGDEIKQWLNQHNDISFYLIIDDDADFLKEQKPFHIRPRTNVGFTLNEFNIAEKILENEGIKK